MFFVENGTFTFVPIGLPRLDTKWIMARRNVLCSGVDISVMKAAMPMLRREKNGREQSRKPEGYVAARKSNR